MHSDSWSTGFLKDFERQTPNHRFRYLEAVAGILTTPPEPGSPDPLLLWFDSGDFIYRLYELWSTKAEDRELSKKRLISESNLPCASFADAFTRAVPLHLVKHLGTAIADTEDFERVLLALGIPFPPHRMHAFAQLMVRGSPSLMRPSLTDFSARPRALFRGSARESKVPRHPFSLDSGVERGVQDALPRRLSRRSRGS